MITDADIKKMKKVFSTKEDLQQLEKKLTNNIVEFKDEILHEIIALREDITVITGYRDMLEDHDKRIEKLEITVYQ